MSDLRRRSLLGLSGAAWDGFLYKDGDEYTRITGGWSADGYSYNNNQSIYAAVKQATSIYGQASAHPLDGYGVGIGLTRSVNLTDFSSLKWLMMGRQAAIMVVPAKSNFVLSYAKYGEFTSVDQPSTQTIDVSDLSGSYYIVTYVMNNGSGSARYFTTQQMWLE